MTVYETSEIPTYPAVGFAGLIALVFVISIFVVIDFLGSHMTSETSYAVRSMQVPEEIHDLELRVFDIANQAAEMTKRKQEHLESYGWTDKSRGLIHIPITEAMTLYLQQRREEP